MQEGNLKSKKIRIAQKKLSWMQKLNPSIYMPGNVYKDFLDSYIGFQGVQTYYYYHVYPNVIDFPLFSAIKIKSLPQDNAKTEEILLTKSLKKLSYSLDLHSKSPDVLSALDFTYKVKWVLLNFKRLIKIHIGKIKFPRELKTKVFKNFDIKTRLRKKELPDAKLHIKKFISSREELLALTPYVKRASLEKMYEIPIEKNPINKNFLELSLLQKFKIKLSEAAKVRPSETKVITVYENIYFEVYKDIKHNAKTDILMCYLDENKKHIQNPKRFYLVFGQRLSDKKIFTIISEA